MKRISTDADHLQDGKVVVDADGIPVQIAPPPFDSSEIDAKLAEMRQIRDEILAAKLTAFDGALTTDSSGAAFESGDIYMDVTTGIIYRKD